MQTDLIRYNLKNRGRQHRGQDRNYSQPASLRKLVAAINSGPTQERVKHGDMIGFYGHWPRAKFGLYPGECAIDSVSGKPIYIEPAVRCTHLKAFDDGTVEHRQEFLNTSAGKLAEKLYLSKTGGFSTAIDEGKPDFAGFDYVFEPNFTGNRGWSVALDAVSSHATLDAVAAADYNQSISGMLAMMEALQTDYRMALDTVASLEEERTELYSLLQQKTGETTLDQVTTESILPIIMPRGGSYLDNADAFKSARREGLAPLADDIDDSADAEWLGRLWQR